jgi:hypothetical protein
MVMLSFGGSQIQWQLLLLVAGLPSTMVCTWPTLQNPPKKEKKSPLYSSAIFHATLHIFAIFELHLNIKEKRRGKKQQQECFMMAGDPIIGIAYVALYYSRSTALTLGNSHPSEIIGITASRCTDSAICGFLNHPSHSLI